MQLYCPSKLTLSLPPLLSSNMLATWLDRYEYEPQCQSSLHHCHKLLLSLSLAKSTSFVTITFGFTGAKITTCKAFHNFNSPTSLSHNQPIINGVFSTCPILSLGCTQSRVHWLGQYQFTSKLFYIMGGHKH